MNRLFTDFLRKFEGIILEVFGTIWGCLGCFLPLIVVLNVSSLGQVVLYTVLMAFPLSKALVKTVAKSLVQNLTKNLVKKWENIVRQIDRKLSEKQVKSLQQTSPKILPIKLEIANKPVSISTAVRRLPASVAMPAIRSAAAAENRSTSWKCMFVCSWKCAKSMCRFRSRACKMEPPNSCAKTRLPIPLPQHTSIITTLVWPKRMFSKR